MTCEMTTGKPGDTVSEVLTVMTAKRFRHMPVVEDGKMVGVVSIGDLVKAKLEETAREAQALREYITFLIRMLGCRRGIPVFPAYFGCHEYPARRSGKTAPSPI